MPKISAGLLLYRKTGGALEVFLVHPGGPFWVRKDDGAWSIPKGEFDEGEDPLDAARREFQEETGMAAKGEFHPLKPLRQSGGKMVYAWAVQFDLDAAAVKSNTFSVEWPPRSGKRQEFPEIDRAGWFRIDEAKRKILKSQLDLLEQVEFLASRA
jgi:predicted NUDIX family NTP pyrophosphohydrolase